MADEEATSEDIVDSFVSIFDNLHITKLPEGEGPEAPFSQADLYKLLRLLESMSVE